MQVGEPGAGEVSGGSVQDSPGGEVCVGLPEVGLGEAKGKWSHPCCRLGDREIGTAKGALLNAKLSSEKQAKPKCQDQNPETQGSPLEVSVSVGLWTQV